MLNGFRAVNVVYTCKVIMTALALLIILMSLIIITASTW